MPDHTQSNIMILVADSDDDARSYIAGLLQNFGFKVIQAVNVGSAIKVLQEWPIDIAFIAEKLPPDDGFEVARHVLLKNMKTNLVMLTIDPTTDLLLEASQNGVGQVMKSPVEPDRLIQTVKRTLRAMGKNADSIGADHEKAYSPEDIMVRVFALADQNAKARLGGPFAAIVTDPQGHILGEGVNSVTTRSDPTAHAELIAIRRAAEKIGRPRLDGCVIYCSAEPTMLGQALIISTGIAKVYYGLSHEESGATRVNDQGILGEITKPLDQRSVAYEQIEKERAMRVFDEWKALKNNIAD